MTNINLHCHTHLSDGGDYERTLFKYRELNMTPVFTDHIYINNNAIDNIKRFKLRKTFANHYNDNIITGIELNLLYEEILIFGSSSILKILKLLVDNPRMSPTSLVRRMMKFKKDTAFILCHPALEREVDSKNKYFYHQLFKLIDGYERYNSGHDYFGYRQIPQSLITKNAFSNSDAHNPSMLATGWNEYDGDVIVNELQLIKFIKSKPTLQLIANPYAGSYVEMGDYNE